MKICEKAAFSFVFIVVILINDEKMTAAQEAGQFGSINSGGSSGLIEPRILRDEYLRSLSNHEVHDLLTGINRMNNYYSSSINIEHINRSAYIQSLMRQLGEKDLKRIPFSTRRVFNQNFGIVLPPRTPRQSATPIVLRGIDFQEVEPDVAAGTIPGRLGKGASSQDIRKQLGGAVEKARQRRCGDAVRAMRSGHSVTPNAPLRDMISNFDQACLFTKGLASPPKLTNSQKPLIANCAAAYGQYAEQCLSQQYGNMLEESITSSLGILTTLNSKGATRILCSATRVSKKLILTARHCLLPVSAKKFSISFRTINAEKLHAVTSIYLENAGNIEKISIKSGIINEREVNLIGKYDVNNDLALLEIENATRVEKWTNKVRFADLDKYDSHNAVMLGGFQRLIFRVSQLKARITGAAIINDEIAVERALWQKAFRIDSSPTCILTPFSASEATRFGINKELVFGHFCQSINAASGSPLFVLRGSAGKKYLELFGVHTGALVDDELESKGDVIEGFYPRNTAIVRSKLFELLK